MIRECELHLADSTVVFIVDFPRASCDRMAAGTYL